MQLYVHISGPTLLATVVLLVVVLAELFAVVVAAQEGPGAVSVADVVTAVALALLTRALSSAALVVLAWDEWISTFEMEANSLPFWFRPQHRWPGGGSVSSDLKQEENLMK